MRVPPPPRWLLPLTIVLTMIVAATAIMIGRAVAEPQQSRAYDARGNSVGTATPIGEGSVRYRDTGGRSLGTSTTTHGTTTFYDARGNKTGSIMSPTGGRK